MNITKTNIDDLNAVIKLQIVQEDYETRVNNVLKDYRKKANINGFRAGKVPMGVIKKMYGTPVLADEINKILSEELMKYIRENDLNIMGEPLPNETEQKEINWEKDTEFEFSFDIALTPEYTLNLSKKDKIDFFKIIVDEKMIQSGVDMHSRRFGSNNAAEVVEEKELLKGNYAQVDADGKLIEEGIVSENVAMSLEYMKDEDAKKKFIGAKKDDVVVFNPAKAFENKSDIASMLNISKEEAETLDSDFQFTITEITKFVNAELNQELFDKVFGEGTVSSEEEFKNKIKEDIEKQLVNDSDYKFLIDAKAKLVKKAKIELPEVFLKRWIVSTNKDMTAEQVDTDFANYADEFKWQLIKNRLIQENDLKVSQEEVMEFAKKQALMQFQQYGMMDVPEEYLNNYAQQMMQNQDEQRKIYERKADDKVVEYIKGTVKLDEKEISTEDFNKLFE
ncbi:trigger factor [Labilibaculum euxinus]|uniref:Trigger factor n=1 Tax=Labilibaculum euxinus TaxID=2686357 RepID=A0A7M4D5G9_9BACT|nr:trigger factor [Labilibaculum euxinus]MUP37898.1 trigger factor [Labilibaculum euxinus]MVB07103.1 trigger factor [Labilibaculum euxinus]